MISRPVLTLQGDLVLLNQALLAFGSSFARKRGYVPLHTPFFMKKDVMAACVQLEQFDEELYHVSGMHEIRCC